MKVRRFGGSGGVTLAADVGGDPGQPPVILMHGGGQTRHSWGKAARDLIRHGYHVISLDLRGHGDSNRAPDGNYLVDAFVADLRAVIASVPGPPALVGASLGGITSLLAVGESDHPIASALVLVDVVARLEEEGTRHIREFMGAHTAGFATLEEAAAAVAAYLPHRPRRASHEGLRKNLRPGADGRLYWHWDPAMIRGMQHIGQSRSLARLQDAARRVCVPTLVVRGALSDVVSRAGVRELVSLVRTAEAVEVEGAGHMIAGDRNDIFNAAVESFLRRTIGSARARVA